MAIVNPNVGTRTGGLLKQILAEREESRQRISPQSAPSAQPAAPLREVVQQPQLQPESAGSARVAAVKPLLGEEAAAAVPPAPTTPGGGAAVVPGAGGVVTAQPDRPTIPSPTPPGPAAPQAAGAPGVAPQAGPTARPTAPGVAPKGQVLGVSTSRVGQRRLIVGLPTRIAPREGVA